MITAAIEALTIAAAIHIGVQFTAGLVGLWKQNSSCGAKCLEMPSELVSRPVEGEESTELSTDIETGSMGLKMTDNVVPFVRPVRLDGMTYKQLQAMCKQQEIKTRHPGKKGKHFSKDEMIQALRQSKAVA